MGTVCADHHHHHKFHHHKPHEIPPRKLVARKECRDPFPAEGSLGKFLPGGGGDSSDSDSDPYSSDHFRMFEFKVRRCTRSRSHDWTDCPFAHPGEKARRRDPRKYHYSGAVCSEHRRGTCSRGDNCEFSHGVFECWLHPSRYRTEACKDGKNCQRKVCFFAHTPRQLRILPVQPDEPPPVQERKHQAEPHCCLFCHSVNSFSSPRSTLLDMSNLSPPLSPSTSLSPPLSPLKRRSLAGLSSVSLCPDRFVTHPGPIGSNGSGISYNGVLNEIVSSFDSMQMNERRFRNGSLPWLDIPNEAAEEQPQPQFAASPSTPSPTPPNRFRNNNVPHRRLFCDEVGRMDGPGTADPDVGWVDELLM
ncbi:hypothetical protein MLD38_003098 [Melastoma candidum]|uniref:Uncharacterized protein n=1 Tax=Melastoma candidum TaxID=119954 RepID=A0ACB9S4M8_9MYRT|nr:hypothetical protein MLD38_003098 [Melastoma candidum]